MHKVACVCLQVLCVRLSVESLLHNSYCFSVIVSEFRSSVGFVTFLRKNHAFGF